MRASSSSSCPRLSQPQTRSSVCAAPVSTMDFYDNFIDKVRYAPPWSPASEQVASSPPCPRLPCADLRLAQILVEPYTYLSKSPGKEVRSQMIAAFNEWMNVPDEELAIVKKVVGMLHTASLLCVTLWTIPVGS